MLANEDIRNSTFSVPVGAFKCIKTFMRISGGNLIILSGDKGNNFESEIRGLRDPQIAVHGSFSMPVNYSLLKSYFKANFKGSSVLQSNYQDGFKVNCFISSKDTSLKFETTKYAFSEYIAEFGPEEFAVLQRGLKDDSKNPSLKSIISLLRLSAHDPDVFLRFHQEILQKVTQTKLLIPQKTRLDIALDLQKTIQNNYPLNPSKDAAFEAGRILLNLDEYSKAAYCFQESISHIGGHYASFGNLALCLEKLNKPHEALEYINRAIDLNPEFKDAMDHKERLLYLINSK
jgi:tetratricopeptide (TPR) repeat protein